MDIQEFEGIINSVITGEHSDEPCRRRFEKKLAAVEEKGPDFAERTFTRQKKFFAQMVQEVIEGNQENLNGQAAQLHRLKSKINGMPKMDAFTVIRSSRRLLRKQIPEFKRFDEVSELVTKKLGGLFSIPDEEKVVECIISGDIASLENLCAKLSENVQLKYLDVLTDEFPENKLFAKKFAVLVLRAKKDYEKALVKFARISLETADDVEIYAILARKGMNSPHMKLSLPLLENYLDNTRCLVAYALNAEKIGDRKAMTLALEKLEDNRGDVVCLTIYAKFARNMKDVWRMEIAGEELEAHLDDPQCLCQFAALAKDLGQTEKMETAMCYLVDHLKDVKCLTTYAGLARSLKDKTEMQRSLILLEPHIKNDGYCLSAYASIARVLNNQRSKLIALKLLKNHLDNEKQKTLYLRLADGEDGASMAC